MRKLFLISSLLLVVSTNTSFGQSKKKQRMIDSIAIRKTVLDYIEGLYEMNAKRVSRSSHVRLMKTNVWRSSANDSFRLSPMTHSQLISMAGSLNKSGLYKADDRKEIIIYDISKQTASVNLIAKGWFDYMQLARVKGEWKIINILYEMGDVPADIALQKNAEQQPQAAAIRQCVMEYIEGLDEKNSDKIIKSTHSRMVKRHVHVEPGADTLMYALQPDLLRDLASPKKWKGRSKVIIYDIASRSASVKLISNSRIEYLHLGNLNGQWKVVNVLWE